MRVLRAAAAVAVASGIALAVPATAHADDVRARQWYLTTLKLAKAHEQATGDGVRIGLIDSGIDPAHQDLTDAVVEGETFGESGAPGGNQNGNGTATAAVLAGRGHGEDSGVLGIAPEAEIVSAAINGGGPDRGELIAQALEYLTSQKVDVITIGIPAPDDEKLRVATQKAAKSGIPVVAAASGDENGEAGFPVGSKGTVNVVGSDKDGGLAPGDAPTPGPDEATTLAAPSQDMQMAVPGDDYTTGGDTGLAAAIVGGTLALVKEKQPDLTGEELITVVRDTASGKGEFDEELGYGIVDPNRAVGTAAAGATGASTGSALGNDNTTLALIIALVGVLGLAALVVVVRSRDARIRRLALAGAPAGLTDTGTMPRLTDTGTMPRLSDTGTFPRVTDTPPHGSPGPHTPPYGQNAPGR